MPPITPLQIVALQRNSDAIRNICILAHVDHGKTSLSDCLLSTNGIISPKLAGRVRYLDSRPDEQLRGITMESSAISLFFRLMRRESETAEPVAKEYLINLIDSPGHIDFSYEVSTASRLCDGAVVLVDAVEGVCSQTVTVLRQTWIENIRPILIINKIDRLITEIKLSPLEAYTHLSKMLEQINAVMGSFFAGERMEEDLKWRETLEARLAATKLAAEKPGSPEDSGVDTPASEYEEKDDQDIYFAPEKHNVIFASAIDGWAFTIRQFASLYEKKLGIKKSVLEKVLWGDFYFDPKTKRVLQQKHLKGRHLKPMFVQLVLENIWAVYESTVLKKDLEKVEKIVKSLGLKILPREMKSKDNRALLASIFAQWLPLSTAVLVTVIEKLPSPPVAQKQRIPNIISAAPGNKAVSKEIENAMVNFDTSAEAPVVAYVSKMVAVPESELKRGQRVQLSAEEMREMGRQKRIEVARAITGGNNGEAGDKVSSSPIDSPPPPAADPSSKNENDEEKEEVDKERLIGFARLYSGTIKVGQQLHVLGPKYSPLHPDKHIQKITVTDLYYMMGRDLQPLDEVPAGNVFGIGGLEGKILKNGTLCSLEKGGVNLAGVNLGAAPIVRVALEPKNPSEMSKMVEGLKLLEQADPCVEYIVQDNGEHVILTAGELHLERCLKDLRERFAKIEIQSSPPIVPYRETIVSASEMSPPKDPTLPRGTIKATIPSKQVSVRIRTRPLPPSVTEFLIRNSVSVKKLYSEHAGGEGIATELDDNDDNDDDDDDDAMAMKAKPLTLQEFNEGLQKAFDETTEKEVWTGVIEKIAAFGPKRIGPNLLIDDTPKGLFRKLLHDTTTDALPQEVLSKSLEDKITHAFQLATSQGPLCNEPVQGIACFVQETTVVDNNSNNNNSSSGAGDEEQEGAGSKNFEVITTVQNAIRQGFLDWSPRLLLAVYSCEIQASTEVLGKVYAVITRRRGRILSEELKEGTPFFTISSLLPVAESFGFSDEIRKKTSGAASPQLLFAGFEILDQDPFWTPWTEDQLEDLGELADRDNVAKRYMDGVRGRKGLFVKRKLVGFAEKQKTLKR